MKRTEPRVQFLGAAGTVTGSCHLVTSGDARVLLDCGMFQGLKDQRERNWREFPFDVGAIDAILLSHAHIDHSGLLPLAVKRGYRGPIICTPATASLLEVMLLDAAYLQEEQAEHANRKGWSRHKPALPLFTVDDATRTLELVHSHVFERAFGVAGTMQATFRHTGHILGSASIDLDLGDRRLVFSGDVGRWGRPIIHDPVLVPAADMLLMESTYGDQDHPLDAEAHLARVLTESAERGGVLVIPAFALGRTQELLWRIRQLEEQGRVPVVPVYLDSPMAIDVTGLYLKHAEEHDRDMRLAIGAGNHPFQSTSFHQARTPEESKKLNTLRGPMVVISASGMATGGRVLHHLKNRLGDRRNTVLLIGYQAAGTRGRQLQEGARSVRIHGQDWDVAARVECIDGLSAHADRGELLRWLGGFERPPRSMFLVHGEPEAAAALQETIRSKLRWEVEVARDREVATIPLARGA